MRAKMVVRAVTDVGYGEKLEMNPVCGDSAFPADGTSEDNTYALFTPSGNLELIINNPALAGKFRVGQKFYVDFTETI